MAASTSGLHPTAPVQALCGKEGQCWKQTGLLSRLTRKTLGPISINCMDLDPMAMLCNPHVSSLSQVSCLIECGLPPDSGRLAS